MYACVHACIHMYACAHCDYTHPHNALYSLSIYKAYVCALDRILIYLRLPTLNTGGRAFRRLNTFAAEESPP